MPRIAASVCAVLPLDDLRLVAGVSRDFYVAAVADAVVIGSRIVQEIEQSTDAARLDNVRLFLAGVRAALDA